jgi:signal transduction histidine kinase
MSLTARFFIQSTVALLLIGFLVLLAIVGTTFWLGERAQIYFNDVIQARDARSAAVELRNAVQTAESSQRGFLVTGNEIYLAPYSTAKTLAQRQLEAVKGALASYPDMEVPVQRLATILSEKFDEMDRTIALKRDRRDAEALAVVRTNRGKALMDEANVFFSGVIRAADDRLTTGVGEQRANATWLRWFSIVGGIVIVVVVGGAATTVLRYTRELGQARDQVNILNAGLEQRVKDRTADLAQANDEIRRFAYIITHDLRAPLVNIMGFTIELEASVASLKTLVDKSDATGQADDPIVREARTAATVDLPEAIGFIRSSTTKMDSLINTILKLSREGRRTLKPETVDLRELIEASLSAIQHQVSQAGGSVRLELSIASILTDKQSLEHIFSNLFDNAVKYRSSSRQLHIDVIATEVPGDRVRIGIADNGRGIADQDRERVFELFRRSGVQDRPGEGIGLAYVRTVVRNLGGDITVTSVFDQGTTFQVVLPLALQVSEMSSA